MEKKPKKQVAVDGRLSHAKDLSVSQVKLLLNLLLRFFTEQAKGFAKKRPKGSDPNELLNQIQKDTPNPDWSQAKIAKYIQRLNKLKDAKAAQGDTKVLSDGTKKIVELLDEICKLFCEQEKGFKAVNKKPAKAVVRKKREETPRSSVPDCENRLDNIILIIGHMEAESKQKITASLISFRMQEAKIDEGQNSNAHVRACLREHRLACQKSKEPVFVAYNANPGGHEYFLTEEGKNHYRKLPTSY